jgi:hypothetical protein
MKAFQTFRALLIVPAILVAIGGAFNVTGLASVVDDQILSDAEYKANTHYDASAQLPLGSEASTSEFKKGMSVKPDYNNPIYISATFSASMLGFVPSLVSFNDPNTTGIAKPALFFNLIVGGASSIIVLLGLAIFFSTGRHSQTTTKAN